MRLIVSEKVLKSRYYGWIVKRCVYDGGFNRVRSVWCLIHSMNKADVHVFNRAKDAKVWASKHRIVRIK